MPNVRMRTIKECVALLKQSDPESSISEYQLRRILKENDIPCIHLGKKVLINADRLLDFLSGFEIQH